MTAKTPAQRKAAERARRAAAGLKEVRGIWATEAQERKIKAYAHKLQKKQAGNMP